MLYAFIAHILQQPTQQSVQAVIVVGQIPDAKKRLQAEDIPLTPHFMRLWINLASLSTVMFPLEHMFKGHFGTQSRVTLEHIPILLRPPANRMGGVGGGRDQTVKSRNRDTITRQSNGCPPDNLMGGWGKGGNRWPKA